MANMDYCKFHNTLHALRDCVRTLRDQAEQLADCEPMDTISDDEAIARAELCTAAIALAAWLQHDDSPYGGIGLAAEVRHQAQQAQQPRLQRLAHHPRHCPCCGNTDPRFIQNNGLKASDPEYTFQCTAPISDGGEACWHQWSPNM